MKKGIIFVFIWSLILGAPIQNASAKTYWLTGAAIGGSVLGGVGLYAGYAACGDLSRRPGSCRSAFMPIGAAVMGVTGFGLGALIGSAFKKKEPIVQTIIDPTTGTYGASVGMSF